MALVLVVDDSSADLYLYRTLLEREGHRVITADNGEEAVKRAKADKPDLVLMDVVMPGMNGFQATRKLSKDPETADIPVVIVSNKDQESDRVWGLRQGARDYLVKGASRGDVLAKVRSVLDG